jgi:transcriptional regulator with XRE-family HTH domain
MIEFFLGKKIRMYRKKAGLTQESMAEKLGLSSKYIQFIENGNRRPSLKVLYKIADLLEIDMCYLFCSKNLSKK